MHTSESYDVIYDQALAKLYVYNNLHNEESIKTQEMFINQLNYLLDNPPPDLPPIDAKDPVRFMVHWREVVLGLIKNVD